MRDRVKCGRIEIEESLRIYREGKLSVEIGQLESKSKVLFAHIFPHYGFFRPF